MQDFTAKDARDLANNGLDAEYEEIIQKITKKAKEGECVLYVYNSSLSLESVQRLEKNGFIVKHASSMQVQRDGIFHSIRW